MPFFAANIICKFVKQFSFNRLLAGYSVNKKTYPPHEKYYYSMV